MFGPKLILSNDLLSNYKLFDTSEIKGASIKEVLRVLGLLYPHQMLEREKERKKEKRKEWKKERKKKGRTERKKKDK